MYLDDVFIYSSSFDQYVSQLNQVLALLKKHKFQLNPQKCEFIHSTINYLGHVVSGTGIQPLPERIYRRYRLVQEVYQEFFTYRRPHSVCYELDLIEQT